MGLNKVGTMMKTIKVYGLSAMCWLVLSVNSAYAEWGNAVVVVSGGWGSADSEFDLSIGDSVIDYPLLTDVSSAGEMAISDKWNGRVKTYRADGSLRNILVPPVDKPKMWTYKPLFIGNNVVIPIRNYYFYSPNAELVAQPESPSLNIAGKAIYRGEIDGNLYVAVGKPSERWMTFSATGELLNTYTEKPLIMGRYKTDIVLYAGNKLQQTTIDYLDVTWVRVDEDDGCSEYRYIRDGGGNVYCALEVEKKIKRFNACGRLVSDFTVPEDDIVWVDAGRPGVEPSVGQINALYGDIVLADNGDIYTSRSATSGYQVVRFPWQASANDRNEGPFAPETLTAQVSGNAVALSWKLSPHDTGCVSGYEVARATVSGGPYTSLATVAKSVGTYTDSTAQSGSTYYYAVRATSSINVSSPYSNEASALAP